MPQAAVGNQFNPEHALSNELEIEDAAEADRDLYRVDTSRRTSPRIHWNLLAQPTGPILIVWRLQKSLYEQVFFFQSL